MRNNEFSCTVVTLLSCVIVISAPSVRSQVTDGVPHLINYQGRLTDSGGDPVTDGEYVVTFAIWSDSISTSPTDRKWISPSCTLLVVNGLFNWQLGSKESLPPWTMTNDANLWLGIQVESDPEITPRTRLCSAPYAYKAWQADYAQYADSAGVALTVPGRIVNILNESENYTTDISDGTFDVSFPPSSFSDAPDVVQCRVVLREASGGLPKGTEAHANVSGITLDGFAVEVVVENGSSTTVNNTAVTLYYLAIQLE